MEAELSVPITPPLNGQTTMSAFIESSETRSKVKRKTGLPLFETPPAKRLKICDFDDDPKRTTVSDFLGQKGTDTTIRVSIQPVEEFNQLSKYLQTLQAVNDRLAALEATISENKAAQKAELDSTRTELEARFIDYEALLVQDVEARLPLLQFNILERLAKKILAINKKEDVPYEEDPKPPSKAEGKKKVFQSPKSPEPSKKAPKSGTISEAPKLITNNHDASTIRLIQDASYITLAQFEKAAEEAGPYKLAKKYFPYIKTLGDYRDERNDEAHDSGRAFAKVLLHPHFKGTPSYHEWAGLVEYVYQMSLEELSVSKPRSKHTTWLF
ncbi:MAG: hypothetical protein Q9212_004569 [Teloschistes hypoglaucus]